MTLNASDADALGKTINAFVDVAAHRMVADLVVYEDVMYKRQHEKIVFSWNRQGWGFSRISSSYKKVE